MIKPIPVSVIGLLLAACTSSTTEVPSDASSNLAELACIEDEDREALLALDYEAFDQDMSGGWRAVSERDGCKIAAAELIVEYREELAEKGASIPKILPWHAGQLYAFEAEKDKAIALFRQSYSPDRTNRSWDLYVSASIAFLQKDRDSFDVYHAELLELPKPENWDEAVKVTEEKFGFTPQWPSNLNVFDAFDRCFGKSYAEAYGECNRGIGKLVIPKDNNEESSESD